MAHIHDSYICYDIWCMIGCFNIQKSSTKLNLQIKYSSPISLFDRLIYLLCQTLYHDMADLAGCSDVLNPFKSSAIFPLNLLDEWCQNQLKQILLFTPILEGNWRLVSLPLYQCNFVCVITFELNVRRASLSDQICWLLIYEHYAAECVLHALMETLPRV